MADKVDSKQELLQNVKAECKRDNGNPTLEMVTFMREVVEYLTTLPEDPEVKITPNNVLEWFEIGLDILKDEYPE